MLCFAEREARILLQGIMVIRKIPVDGLLDVQDKQSQRVYLERLPLLETCARLNSISEIGLFTCGAGRESARRKKKSKKITY
jgi:hypothetical protein